MSGMTEKIKTAITNYNKSAADGGCPPCCACCEVVGLLENARITVTEYEMCTDCNKKISIDYMTAGAGDCFCISKVPIPTKKITQFIIDIEIDAEKCSECGIECENIEDGQCCTHNRVEFLKGCTVCNQDQIDRSVV